MQKYTVQDMYLLTNSNLKPSSQDSYLTASTRLSYQVSLPRPNPSSSPLPEQGWVTSLERSDAFCVQQT